MWVVLALYEKQGGKAGRLNCVPDSNSISRVSSLSVQTFDHFRGRVFETIHGAAGQMLLRTYRHIPSYSFIHMFADVPTYSQDGTTIELRAQSAKLWELISISEPHLPDAMKEFRKRKQDTDTC
jgi:hypothetical protein